MNGSALRATAERVDGVVTGHKNGSMTKEQLAHFAEVLRTGRAKMDLTKLEFCKKVGITPNTLRALERGGGQHPSPQTIEKVAAVLGMSVTALTTGRQPIEQNDPRLAGLTGEDLQIARAFHDSSTHVRQRVMTLLEDGREEFAAPDHRRIDDALSRRLEQLTPEERRTFLEAADLLTRTRASATEPKTTTATAPPRTAKGGHRR